VAFARAQPGEVEPQDADPAVNETACDPSRSGNLLRARKAVGEQRVRDRLGPGKIEPSAQAVAARAAERELLDAFAHDTPSRTSATPWPEPTQMPIAP